MFVWVWGFSWLVWLLCACGVRRLRGLWRVCLYFVLFCPLLSSFLSSILSFCSCVCLSFYLFAPAFFVCPLVLCLSSLFAFPLFVGCCCFFFPYGCMRKKERALRVGASSLVLLWVVGLLCKIWLPVLVKFVIVGLDFFGNTFI